MKRLSIIIMSLLAYVLEAGAVLKEANIDSTLHVLRMELTEYHSTLERQQEFMKDQQERVRTQLYDIMNRSNQNAMMLYSQKEGHIFDLTYACHQATEQFRNFQNNIMPFRKFRTETESEIARFDSLVVSLSEMPKWALSERAQTDRNVCLTYAINIRRTLKSNADQLSDYIRYYQLTEVRLKRMNDYAIARYNDIQTSIFRNGGDSYLTILSNLHTQISETTATVVDKYKPIRHAISQWDSRIILFLFVAIVLYGFIATLLSIAVVRLVLPRFKRFQSQEFISKRPVIILASATVLFAIILGILQVFMRGQNFIVMASGLLVEYAWLLGVILISLLVRLNGMQIVRGIRIYAPIICIGFLVISFRIILIPNDLVELIFPPILVACALWQWHISRHLRQPELTILSDVKEAQFNYSEATARLNELINRTKTDLDDDTDLTAELSAAEQEKAQTEAEYLRLKQHYDEYRLPKSDYNYATMSLLVFIGSLACSAVGYTLLSVQILIWWVMQLTCILTITCVTGWMEGYAIRAREKMRKQIDAYNKEHHDDVELSEERILLDHWPFRVIRRVLLPIVAVFSFALSLYWAADVFNLSDNMWMLLTRKIVNTSNFSFDVLTLMIAICTFFIFRFINNITKALWKEHLAQKHLGDTKTVQSRSIMGKNIIQTVIWGVWFLMVLKIFQISNQWIVVISGGLSTGIGFASKDILENIYYGISLMAGRVKIGDMIQINGIRGTVNSISYTSTTIETIDGSIIAFQNSQLFANNYKNLTRNHGLELDVLEVGVAYGTDIARAKQILIEAISKVPGVETKKRKVNVVLKSFGDNAIELKILVWVDVVKQYYIDGYVLEAVYNALNDNGIGIPFPQRDIHIIHADEDQMRQIAERQK